MTAANTTVQIRQNGGFWFWARNHRRLASSALVGGHAGFFVAGAAVFQLLFPDVSGYVQSGILTLIVATIWAALLYQSDWSREIGFVGTAEWRHLRLLIFPAILALLPILGGVHGTSVAMMALMVSGYLATGLFEEAMYRGVLLRLFLDTGTGRAVVISSLFFGLMHLENILFRDNPMMVLSQAIGVFCFGVGYSVLRLRTNTIWPLIILHFLTDFTLQLTNLPLGAKIGLMVGQDTLLLIYGVYLFRRTAIREIAVAS